MISGSSSGHACIWVNGCQTWRRSSASSSSCVGIEELLEAGEREVELRVGVAGADREPQPAGAGRHGGRSNRLGENAALAQKRRGLQRALGLAEDDGEDRRAR